MDYLWPDAGHENDMKRQTNRVPHENQPQPSAQDCSTMKSHKPFLSILIAAAPLANPFLKYELSGIRKYKGGKLRILYALSTERQELWGGPLQEEEILFLYVDLRSDDTYKEALKHLRKHNLV